MLQILKCLRRAYPIRLRDGSKVTPNWFHYPQIAKFNKLFCLFINIFSNYSENGIGNLKWSLSH